MDAPSAEKIAAIKSQFPGRVIRLVELEDNGETYRFILTGPNAVEYKKYMAEMIANQADITKAKEALERAALAQIRWPDRDAVKDLFDAHPAFPDQFGQQIHEAAGAGAEVRSKNL